MPEKIDEIDWDMLYYMYCIKLNRTDDDFWNSSISKITKMIDIYADEQNLKSSSIDGSQYESKYFTKKEEESQVITSMSQITA